MSSESLTLKNLSKAFPGGAGVKPANVTIPEGAFASILGPSGCGKTTTLMLVAGIEKPDTGTVLLGNRDITHMPVEKRGIGIVFQDYALFPNLTVRENILYGLTGRVSETEAEERLAAMLHLTNLEGMSNRRPSELSGGQQQRVAIARAVVTDCPLILADEPTGNLDSTNGAEVMELLSELNKQGTTIVMVTHSERDAGFAHRIIHLLDGRIVS